MTICFCYIASGSALALLAQLIEFRSDRQETMQSLVVEVEPFVVDGGSRSQDGAEMNGPQANCRRDAAKSQADCNRPDIVRSHNSRCGRFDMRRTTFHAFRIQNVTTLFFSKEQAMSRNRGVVTSIGAIASDVRSASSNSATPGYETQGLPVRLHEASSSRIRPYRQLRRINPIDRFILRRHQVIQRLSAPNREDDGELGWSIWVWMHNGSPRRYARRRVRILHRLGVVVRSTYPPFKPGVRERVSVIRPWDRCGWIYRCKIRIPRVSTAIASSTPSIWRASPFLAAPTS